MQPFFFNDPATTEIYTLSLHDALPISLPEVWLRRVIGGVGLGAWLLYEHARPGCDPRGPDNALVLTASPLLGSGLTTATKFALVTKSPQTGFITDSLSSS